MNVSTQRGGGTARRGLLRAAALGGGGVAAAALLPRASASAAAGAPGSSGAAAAAGSPGTSGVPAAAGDGLVFPGVDVAIDASHATPGLARLVRDYLAAKSRHDPEATMEYFSRSTLTYIDGVLGWNWYTWNSLLAALEDFMPNWPADGKSYPTRVLGDTTGAIVVFTDTAGLFGVSEIRAIGVVDFTDRKITRQIDYWDGRHFGIAATEGLRNPPSAFPADFRESTVGEHAAPTLQLVVRALAQALRDGDGAAAAQLFGPGAVFTDVPAHVEITGPGSIGAYLTAAAKLLPYAGDGSAVRHIVGSAIGGGYEWTAANGPVPRGVTALELDRWGRITRLTAMWDGSLIDEGTLSDLGAAAIER